MARTTAVLEAYLGISSQSQEEAILRLLIELGAQFAGAHEGSLLVLDEKKNDLVFAMTVGDKSSQSALIGQRVPLGKGITGLAAQMREVQIGAPTFKTRQARKQRGAPEEPQAVLAAPMLASDQLMGVLTAISFEPGKRFTTQDALLYGRLAAVAGVVVNQSRQLRAMQALQSGEDLPRGVTEEERLEHEMVSAVTRLTQSRPQSKKQIARLLTTMADLLEE
jgi:sigma-B regulation protein RsbU (phosphoserine phosphatase)